MRKPTKYHRLDLNDREEISRCLVLGWSFSQTAHKIGRHRSTVVREVRKAGMNRYTYRAGRSQRRAVRLAGKRRRGKCKLSTDRVLRRKVIQWIHKRYSPQQIAKRLQREYPQNMAMRVSHEAIYSYLYVLPKGRLKKELLSCLRRERKRRRRQGRKPSVERKLQDMILIDKRPKNVEKRVIPGHWEGDLLLGKNRQSSLGSLVERKTRFLMLVKLKNRKAYEVQKAFTRKIKHLPKKLRQSLTYDQGREMAQHKLFTRNTRMKVYFAHPASPWERGTNENTNGLIRQFFPKGTDFNKVSSHKIRWAESLLNDRPRKVLNWDKPSEAMARALR